MTTIPLKALLWRQVMAADLDALFGHGGGHAVLPWGPAALWREKLNIDVALNADNGTRLPLVSDQPPHRGMFDLELYRHTRRNGEVRVKLPPLLRSPSSISGTANRVRALVDPDQGGTDTLVVFLAQTVDERFHLRALLRSQLPEPLATWVMEQSTGGRTMTAGVTLDSPLEQRVWQALLTHHNVLLYGPPGTGKTRLMLKIKEAFENGLATVALAPDQPDQPFVTGAPAALPAKRIAHFTTFHQSLSYESFVVGLRPAGGNTFSFTSKNGLFLRLAQHALQADAASLLLIDEFNRGNVADIFGELITLLEPSKRLRPDGKSNFETVTVTLPLEPEKDTVPQQFALPHHLYVLASMNSLDRSVAPIDSAMRRRFRLIHIEPDLESLARHFFPGVTPATKVEDSDNPTEHEVRSIAYRLIERLNRHIRAFWGPEFLLGQAYVWKVQNVETLADAWEESVMPQVMELYRDHPEALARLLGTRDDAGEDALVSFSDTSRDSLLGGRASAPPEIVTLRGLQPAKVISHLHWAAFERGYEPSTSTPVTATSSVTTPQPAPNVAPSSVPAALTGTGVVEGQL